MLKKRFKGLYALSMILVLAFSSINVLAAEGENINAEASEVELASIALEDEYNIMLYDYDGKIISEYHTDGEVVTYSYEDEILCGVESSNGNSAELSVQDGIVSVSLYKDDQHIETYNIEENTNSVSWMSVSIEESVVLLKAASEGKLVTHDVDSGSVSVLSDTISSGYNLSTLCPSVWTSSYGYDRFGRPSTAMSKSDIQAFLESKNSVLSNDILIYRIDSNGNVYNTGETINPATAIDNASQTYWINPKIILGSLQREQGLITKTSGDVSTRSFYFCMGYGATDSGDINSYTGFDIQIDRGTKRYAELWSEAYNMGQSAFPLAFAASDGTVYINNCGTYALYRYTPWQSSNLLFLKILKGYWPDSSGVNGINWE